MKKILMAFAMVLAFLVPVSPTPAYAGECTLKVFRGNIRHYSPDNDLDTPIWIRCDYGNTTTNHKLYEGQHSSKYCKDTDQINVGLNEEIWCKYLNITDTGKKTYIWRKKFDKAGWHKISDIWDDGEGCTKRAD